MAVGKTILLVEDEEQVMRLLVKVLEMRGFIVLQAPTGTQALRLGEEHDGHIDLLLADVELEDHMNGPKVARQLRRTRPGLRVLYTSGYPFEIGLEREGAAVRREASEYMAGFLPKPFTPAVLAENVRYVLEEMPT
jgi:two-component system, cell cycle sensor histidine kinase and response regulator CckA